MLKEEQLGTPVNCNDSELSIYLLALAEGFLPTSSSDTSAYVQSKTMSIASKSYQRGRKTVTFPGFPSLQMSKNLTDDLGAGLLMSSQAASRAPTLAQPDAAPVLTDNKADSGARWRALSVRYDLDTHSWRTPLSSGNEVLPESSVTLPKWGSIADGELLERTTAALPTLENVSGYWPTPVARDDGKSPEAHMAMKARMKGGARKKPTSLTVTVKGIERGMWPTPTANRRNGLQSHGVNVILGQLNPAWVEWLMNWPIGWTSLEPMNQQELEFWKETSAAYLRSDDTRDVWFESEAGAPPREALSRTSVGTPSRTARLKAIGNGQVPRAAATAFNILSRDD